MIINIFIANFIQIVLFHYYISKFLKRTLRKEFLYFFYLIEIIILVFVAHYFSVAYSSILFYLFNILVISIFFKANISDELLNNFR